MRVLIAGCGYVGTELARRLATGGDTVFGLRRDASGLPAGVEPISADLTVPATLARVPDDPDAVVYAASPDGRAPEAYRAAYVDGLANLLAVVEGRGALPRIVLVSSTAVYGQDDGGWVDEDSPADPPRSTSRTLLEAERLAHQAGGTVLRLGGIYGPARTRLVEQVRRGEAVCAEGPPAYTNRIHRDDAAGALAHLLSLDRPAPVYLGVDDEPADRCTVLRWLADRLGAPPPRVVPPDQAPRRRAGNKRCRNARLRSSGYDLAYPTFREGYGALLA